MPLYEFRCKKCESVFEQLLLIRSNTKPACPECGSRRTDKLFSTFGVSGSARRAGASCSSCASNSCATCGR